jgi:hypothetical protein
MSTVRSLVDSLRANNAATRGDATVTALADRSVAERG